MTETKLPQQWMTVKEASLHCFEMGLPRSTKSIRRWCQFENVEAQKRQVANTEKWFIDRGSLEIKVKEELEFLQHSEKEIPVQPDITGQGSEVSGHDQTRPVIGGHERSQADTSGRGRTQADMGAHKGGQGMDAPSKDYVKELEHEIQSLKIDVAVNNQLKDQFKSEYLKGINTQHAQARYIGHLENDLLRLGGKPDEKFLAAPTPKEESVNSPRHVEPEIVE